MKKKFFWLIPVFILVKLFMRSEAFYTKARNGKKTT